MKSFNQVMFIGHVGKEPVVRVVKKEDKEDVTVCHFSLAVDEGKEKDTLWLSITAWRTLADQVKTYVHTGDLLLVTGKLSIHTYSDKENIQRTAVEIIATDIRFLHAKKETAAQHTAQPEPAATIAA
jgi:single-strand DNA-binding protein